MGCSKPDARSARPAQRGKNCPCPPLRKSFSHSPLQIINHQSSIINPLGFTLIELLVVISIIVLLMAILLPGLQRVRRQAKAVACQANLHQWGILYATYTAENDGYLPNVESDFTVGWWALGPHGLWNVRRESLPVPRGLYLCPMATKLGDIEPYPKGGTFLAWTSPYVAPDDPLDSCWRSSYAENLQAHSWWGDKSGPRVAAELRFMWMTSAVKNASAVPVFFDTTWGYVSMYDDKSPPPEYDAIPTREIENYGGDCVCINRHEGGINSLFMDWSVRKVGLKELWTLKWWSQYNTRGPWTKAGGAEPEDWPQWMRGFKDY